MPRSLARILTLLLAALLLVAVFAVYQATIGAARLGELGFLPYAYSELLINYSAGFIRRGLLGAGIASAAHGGSALPVVAKLLFCNYLLLTGALLALAFTKLKAGWRVLLLCLMPCGVLTMAFMGEFWSRKEIFFFTLLAFSGLLKVVIGKVSNSGLRGRLAEALIVLIVLESVWCSLVHDGFTFMAAPANAYLIQSLWRLRAPGNAAQARKLPWAYLGTQLVIFFVLGGVFHTDTHIANQIWASLAPSDRAFFPGVDRGGITTLTLGLRAVIGNLPRLLNQGMLWWYLGPWLCLFLYCALVVDLSSDRNDRGQGWLRCYVTIALMALPMYIMGYDYGRWTSAIQMSFLIVWMSTAPAELRELQLLPDGVFSGVAQRLGAAWQHLRAIGSLASSLVRRHIAATVVAMLVFDTFSYLPEVAPGIRWTSVAKQLVLWSHVAVGAMRHHG